MCVWRVLLRVWPKVDVSSGVLGCDVMFNEDAPAHDLCTTKTVIVN